MNATFLQVMLADTKSIPLKQYIKPRPNFTKSYYFADRTLILENEAA